MAISESHPAMQASEHAVKACPCWLYAALAVSLIGVAGGLALTWVDGKIACPLCFYQRVFVMAAAGTLALGVFLPDLKPGRASLLALPSAMGGFAVAVFHVNLVYAGKWECPDGLLGLGPAPLQSLILFVILLLTLGGDLIEARKAGHGIHAVTLIAGLLGLMFALALVYSGPPPPDKTKINYDVPPLVCRPPQ